MRPRRTIDGVGIMPGEMDQVLTNAQASSILGKIQNAGSNIIQVPPGTFQNQDGFFDGAKGRPRRKVLGLSMMGAAGWYFLVSKNRSTPKTALAIGGALLGGFITLFADFE